MRGVLVVVIVAIGLIGTLWSRFIGLLLYVWFALFRPQEWAYGTLTQLRLSMIVWIAVMVLSVGTGALPNITHPLSLATLAFLGCALLAQLNATSPEVGWMWIETLVTTMSIALLAVTLTKNRRQFTWLLAVVAGSIGFHAAKFGAGFIVNGGVRYTEGIGGMFDENNGFALAITRVLFLLVAVAQITGSKLVRFGFFAAVPLSAITVVGTYSRGGFLAMAAAALTFFALQRRRGVTLAVAGVAVAVALVTVPIPSEYFDRLETIRTYEDVGETSALSRLHFWRVALAMANDNPLGVGVKNYEVMYDRYDFLDGLYGRARAVHSTHFQVLAETGYLGFLVYVFLLTHSVRLCWRLRSRARTAGLADEDRRFLNVVANSLLASLAAFVVGGSFGSVMLNDLNWFTFALVAVADRISRQMLTDAVTAPRTAATPGVAAA